MLTRPTPWTGSFNTSSIVERRADPEGASEIRDALQHCSLAVDVGFLDSEILERWLQVGVNQAGHPADWERFHYQASRHLRERGVETPEDWERFRDRS